MHILLSCSKTMTSETTAKCKVETIPNFQENAAQVALFMTQKSVGQLEVLLKVNTAIALENLERYQIFHSPDTAKYPAITAYSGIVFKHIDVDNFSAEDSAYAQKNLKLTSFLYGLLRPFDAIKLYRLEGNVKLDELGGITMFNYWKPLLTDFFINEINKSGGILCNVASNEMKSLFQWSKVVKSVKRIITPEFKVLKNGSYKTIVVYTKMCRGEMTKFIIKNRVEDPELLKTFEWEGFRYNDALSEGDNWVFTNEGI